MGMYFWLVGVLCISRLLEDGTQSDLQENALRRYGNDENDDFNNEEQHCSLNFNVRDDETLYVHYFENIVMLVTMMMMMV